MIVKVGGSVADKLDVVFKAISSVERVFVVPGGWIFADTVRETDREMGLSDNSSHWMSIAAMNMYGYIMAEIAERYGFPAFEPEDFRDFNRCRRGIILPYILLRRNDELPHSWAVTSDSIAVWIASKLKYKDVVKVTAAGGIRDENGNIVSRVEAYNVESSVIDTYTPHLLLKFKINMFICSPEELKNYILRGRAKGTLIEGR